MNNNKILKPSHIIKLYKISNKIKWYFARLLNKINKIKVLTKRIDDNYDKLDYKIDDVENDLNDYSIYQDKKIKELKKDVTLLMNVINKDDDDKVFSNLNNSYYLSEDDLKMALNKIVFDINEGIKYGSLSGINSHKKELRVIVNKHINLGK